MPEKVRELYEHFALGRPKRRAESQNATLLQGRHARVYVRAESRRASTVQYDIAKT